MGVVARLEPEKGHPTLLDAWPLVLRRVPDAWLLIVGEGSERERWRPRPTALGIAGPGRLHRPPRRRPGGDRRPGRRRPALLPRGAGPHVLEAMALSRPVVASNVGGIPEMIEDGVTGLLVPPHDCDALAAAIVRLLTDHPLADMLARGGHDLVHERFCVELMVSAIEDLYDEGALRIRQSQGVAR